jgi:cytochrome b involved in lipid metabolism
LLVAAEQARTDPALRAWRDVAVVLPHTSRPPHSLIIPHHQQVYDLTPYVNEHPGGVAAMLRNAGGDATAGFHGPQHPARVFDIIDDFEIGGLAEE